ncbi:hypothetical protein ATANTOWER_017139 [Ataeniobius toweri]|uniref:Uncharacterized protein n=1 Tax=Ataeniobius toweri TaxID=208326 RepID=A0ABU7CAB8_9TELE|nr:hypothetical protein [Ataeniobius toweri]
MGPPHEGGERPTRSPAALTLRRLRGSAAADAGLTGLANPPSQNNKPGTGFQDEDSRRYWCLLTSKGAPYLVADVLGGVRVSSAPASLPQLRHVSLVSPRGR